MVDKKLTIKEKRNLKELEKKAKSKKYFDVTNLARAYIFKYPTDSNRKKGFNLLLKFSKNNTLFYYQLAQCYESGYGTQKDELKAFQLYKKDADSDYHSSFSSAKVGIMYYEGKCVKQDYNLAVKYLKVACDGNCYEPYALIYLGACYLNGWGTEEDDKLAFELLTKAKSLPSAKYWLGVIYYNGLGVEKDYVKAYEFIKESATNYHREAYYLYGLMNFYGYGTKIDYSIAFEYLSRVKEEEINKYRKAIYLMLGECYFFGKGTAVNYKMAESNYLKAEKEGYDIAISRLAFLYYYTNEYSKAISYAKRAVEKGLFGYYVLAECTFFGLGTNIDINKAKEYYELGVKNNELSCLDRLAQFYANNTYPIDDKNKIYDMVKDRNTSRAKLVLYCCYKYGYGVKINLDKAYDYLFQADKEQLSEVIIELARLYFYGSNDGYIKEDKEKAFIYNEKGAKLENSDCCARLAYIHIDDSYDRKNYDKAFYWSKEAYDKGNYKAAEVLVFCYLFGKGTTKNEKLAVNITMEGLEKGNSTLLADYLVELQKGYTSDVKRFFKYIDRFKNRYEHKKENDIDLYLVGKVINLTALYYPDGSKMCGVYKNNTFEGKVVKLGIDGSAYIGNIVNGLADGYGKLYKNGSLVYSGQWKKGQKYIEPTPEPAHYNSYSNVEDDDNDDLSPSYAKEYSSYEDDNEYHGDDYYYDGDDENDSSDDGYETFTDEDGNEFDILTNGSSSGMDSDGNRWESDGYNSDTWHMVE